MAFDEKLAARIRAALGGTHGVTERKMMGGICFMVGGNMCCGVIGDALIVRVGREGTEPALAKPHVRPLEFAGRRTGGFVLVDPPGHAGAACARWIGQGVGIAEALPKKAKKPTKKSAARKKRAKIG
jgi:hypothetical protein